jgi:hypothetical protein
MRWKTVIMGLALVVAVAAGCKQQCFLTECDWNHYHEHLGLPKNLDCNPASICQPPLCDAPKAPATVLQPDRPIRYLSLAEAISIALEQGTLNGGAQQGQPRLSDRNLVQGLGGAQNLDSIRVLAIAPAVEGARMEYARRFDARWITSTTWNYTDQPVVSAQQVFTSGGLNSIEQTTAQFPASSSSRCQRAVWPASRSRTTTRSRTFPTGSTQLHPNLQFLFEQPLLQGYGVEINQLRPASEPQLAQFGPLSSPDVNVLAILITRLFFDVVAALKAVCMTCAQRRAGQLDPARGLLGPAFPGAALRQAYEAFKITRETAARHQGCWRRGPEPRPVRTVPRRPLGGSGASAGSGADPAASSACAWRMARGWSPATSRRAPYNPDWDVAVHQARRCGLRL